ncbi:restriction endonuclease [Geothrix sp. 21YS21S-4]|uniref:restriction endonuclease n=1 Tax=Geothrix sp. 21YS21S-4 TaxID=3068889 RepID=UPI0027B9AB4F|nr:restriction endonuclease [Geothrix sp. 21YS21S-4]
MVRSKLLKLTPTEFENLIYDLMILNGLQNAVWRTPGADGGRDIEGQALSIDLSGNIEMQKWYVECKRYSKSIDWPTVYGKIAYADNHGADYLLLCTTTSYSPNCKTEISNWNRARRRPIVRVWDSVELERKISHESVLLIKYGLEFNDKIIESSIFSLTQFLTKVVQGLYGLLAIDPISSNFLMSIELSAALSELISVRTESAKLGDCGNWKKFRLDKDLYDWCNVDPLVSLSGADCHGLRALLASIRYFNRSDTIKILPADRTTIETAEDTVFYIQPSIDLSASAVTEAFRIISLWSNLEITADINQIKIILRQQ